MSSGEAWARRRSGPRKVLAEYGPPARREAAEQPDAQLVSHGVRSERVPREERSADDWLRHGDGEGGVWERIDVETSDE